MAIFDPSQQIQQLGQQNAQSLNQFAQRLTAQDKANAAQTSRFLSQIDAIAEEANAMHRDFVSNKRDEILAELKDKVFSQRQDGTTKINLDSMGEMRSSISKLGNMVANSQHLAEKYKEFSELAIKDPYTMNRGVTLDKLMNIVADPEALASSPREVESQLYGVYNEGLDNNQRVIDSLRKKLEARTIKRSGLKDDAGNIYGFSRTVFNGIHDNNGNFTREADAIIDEEIAKLGAEGANADVIKNAFSKVDSYEIEKRAEDIQAEEDLNAARINKLNQKPTPKGNDRVDIKPFIRAVVSGREVSAEVNEAAVSMLGGIGLKPDFVSAEDLSSQEERILKVKGAEPEEGMRYMVIRDGGDNRTITNVIKLDDSQDAFAELFGLVNKKLTNEQKIQTMDAFSTFGGDVSPRDPEQEEEPVSDEFGTFTDDDLIIED